MGMNVIMAIRVPEPVTRTQVRQWSWQLAVTFAAYHLDDGNSVRCMLDHRPLRLMSSLYDAGRTPEPESGTQIYVGVSMRWSLTHEREGAFFITSIAEWLERTIPNSRVFVDSDGWLHDEMKTPFGQASRRAMLDAAACNDPRADSRYKCCDCEQPMEMWRSGGAVGDSVTVFRCVACGEYVTERWRAKSHESVVTRGYEVPTI